jgi:hypothetical protein
LALKFVPIEGPLTKKIEWNILEKLEYSKSFSKYMGKT